MTGKDLLETGDATAEGFDDCILGVAQVVIGDKLIRKVVYDADAMVEQMAREFSKEMNGYHAEEAAFEYLEFNTFGAFIGPQTPLYVWRNEAEMHQAV